MKVIIYTRVSTDEQANNGHGRDYQMEVLKRFCKANNHEIINEYLEDHSAKNFDRPEWKKLETFVKANRKQVDKIIFTKWDRFSRNMEEALYKIRMFRNWGIEVNAVEQTLDLSNPDNKMMLSIYLVAPEIENDKISQRTKAGMHKAAKEGAWIGRVPFGYKRCRVGKKYASLESNENSEIVIEMFKRAAMSIGSIEQLRKDFIPLGYKRCKQSFYNLLRSKVFVGMVKVPQFEKEDTYWVDGLHNGIVDDETFNKVQDVLNGNKNNAKSPSKRNESLPLRGFLECEFCGGTLTGSPSKGNGGVYHYYHCRSRCKNRIRSEKAHEMLTKVILNTINVNDNVLELYKDILIDVQRQKSGSKKQSQKKIIAQINESENNIESLEDKLVCGDISSDTFNKISKRYHSNLRDLRNDLQFMKDSKATSNSVIENACNTLSKIPQLFEESSYDKKIDLLGLMFPEKLVISKNGCRTKKLNIVIELLTRVDKGFKSIGKEKAIISDGLSNYAPLLGLEPRTL
jgi:site-specific DNA recombinase